MKNCAIELSQKEIIMISGGINLPTDFKSFLDVASGSAIFGAATSLAIAFPAVAPALMLTASVVAFWGIPTWRKYSSPALEPCKNIPKTNGTEIADVKPIK